MSDSEIFYSSLSGVAIKDEISEVCVDDGDEALVLEGKKRTGAIDPALSVEFKESGKNLNLYDKVLVGEFSKIPDKMGFKIGEVADLVGIRQYVLRYWESEFEPLKPKRSKSAQRMYTRRDIEIVMMIKKLLYRDKFSIEGAKKALRVLKSQHCETKKWNDMTMRYKSVCSQMEKLVSDVRDMRERLFSSSP